MFRSYPAEFVDRAVSLGVWKKHSRACLRGIVLHSQKYVRAPKSASHRVSFWHTPNSKEYGSIKFFLTCIYQDTPLLLSLVDWHPAIPSAPLHSHLLLAQKAKAPSPHFINTLSIYSQVLFLHNNRLPTHEGSQTMVVVDDINYKYQ